MASISHHRGHCVVSLGNTGKCDANLVNILSGSLQYTIIPYRLKGDTPPRFMIRKPEYRACLVSNLGVKD